MFWNGEGGNSNLKLVVSPKIKNRLYKSYTHRIINISFE